MSDEISKFEMIYKPNISIQNVSPDILCEMIYKPNEDKKEKKEKMKKFRREYNFKLDDAKEYSEDILRIFGKKYVVNNRNKCKIIYENKKYKLREYLEDIDNNYKIKNIIKLKLYDSINITDMSYMFYGCYHLFSISESEKKNIQNNSKEKIDNFSEDKSYSSLYEELKMNSNKGDIEDKFG